LYGNCRETTSQSKSRKPGSWELGGGAHTWEWDYTFEICSSQKYVCPSSQLPVPNFIELIGQALGARSWELVENPYRITLKQMMSSLKLDCKKMKKPELVRRLQQHLEHQHLEQQATQQANQDPA
jgi:hypothetical protein